MLVSGRQVDDIGPRVFYPVRVSLSPPLTEIERQYVRPVPSDKEIEIVEGVRKHYGYMEPVIPITDPVGAGLDDQPDPPAGRSRSRA